VQSSGRHSIENKYVHIKQQLFACALLAGATPLTHAQSTSDLALGGSITPAACAIDIQNNGVADYGVINKVNLNPDPAMKTFLTEIVLTTTVACGAPTRYAFRAIDNRTDSRGGVYSPEFGLGKTPEGLNIGGLGITMGYLVRLDGAWSYTTKSPNGGASWNPSGPFFTNFPPMDTEPNTLHGHNRLDGDTAGPSMATNGSYVIRYKPVIRPANELLWTDDITLDGSATLELVYL
jgi:hypothetical protein